MFYRRSFECITWRRLLPWYISRVNHLSHSLMRTMIMWHLYACRQAVLRSSHKCDRLLLHWPTARLAVLLPLQLRSGWIDTRCLNMNSDGDDGWKCLSCQHYATLLLLGMAFGSLFQVLALFTLIFVFEDYLYSKAITINETSNYGSISLDSSSNLGF